VQDTAVEDEALVQLVQRLQRRADLAGPAASVERGVYARACVDALCR
jgi:hypothetical protein